MHVHKKYQIEKVVSQDCARQSINSAHLDCDSKVLVATNGHAMAIVPIVSSDDDESGPITVDAIKVARKNASKSHGMGGIHANGKQDIQGANGGIVASMPRPVGVTFPPWKMVVPKEPAQAFTVGINARLLYDLACALGAGGADSGVVLTFDAGDPEAGIRVRPAGADGAYGVIMPRRVFPPGK